MTHSEMLQKIDRIMSSIESTISSDPSLPRRTGNLASSVKIRKVSDGYEIYIDDGNMTTEEWEANPVFGVAPYAAELEEQKPYMRRLAFSIRDKINFQIGAEFKTEHIPNTRGGK